MTLDVCSMVPIAPEDNVLLTLLFRGAVICSIGAPDKQVSAILEAKRKDVLQSKGLNESEEEAEFLHMGIISEKDIHDYDGNVYVIPAPAPASVAIKPKADNNDAAYVIDAVIVESAYSQTTIAASGGDGVSGALEGAAGSATS